MIPLVTASEVGKAQSELTPSKAKYVQETDSEQVPWGKDEKHFEKRVK